MAFARRQYNATILSDGTVLVTGGSSGADFNNISFKDAARKERWPVLTPELWNPNFIAQKWKKMASERFNRCYYFIALLLLIN
jgi:galactose oxidase